MRIRCGRCGKRFEPEQPWHSLCKENCWEEVGCYGDEEAIRFWKIGSTFANTHWIESEMKEFSDCAVGQELLHSLLDHMDGEMKYRLLKKEIDKLL